MRSKEGKLDTPSETVINLDDARFLFNDPPFQIFVCSLKSESAIRSVPEDYESNKVRSSIALLRTPTIVVLP